MQVLVLHQTNFENIHLLSVSLPPREGWGCFQDFVQHGSHSNKVLHKAPIVRSEPKKAAYIIGVLWNGPTNGH
ncbi:unnamed protein product, partial [Dicrocoelium dendriticum]